MTWLLAAALALVALAPLALLLLRPARLRGRRDADLALYRAQLAELDRDLAAGRLDAAAHAAARTEVQRRLLAAPEDAAAGSSGKAPLLLALAVLPVLALGLYLLGGQPDMPSAPYVERRAVAEREEGLLSTLRARIASLPAESEPARQGWYLLGNAERRRGHYAEAAAAWQRALAIRFDADLAGALAEVEIERGETDAAARLITQALAQQPQDPRLRFLAGLVEARAGRTETARTAWRALLSDSPADAPWRALVERALAGLN